MDSKEQINSMLSNDEENMMLLCDFYKICHRHMYPAGTTKLYATWTPRSNEYFQESDKMIWFGLQGFIKKYLISYFNRLFFLEEKSRKSWKSTYSTFTIPLTKQQMHSISKLFITWDIFRLRSQHYRKAQRSPTGFPA